MGVDLAIAGWLASYGNENTRKTYERNIDLFKSWCESNDLKILIDVKRPHVEMFARYLEVDRGNAPTSVQQRLISIRTFYNYCEIDGYISRNPAAHVRLPKVWIDESTTLGLDRMELSTLIQTAKAHQDPTRWALVVLMGMLGLRVSEACSIQISDYGSSLQGHTVIRLIGKGGKPATIPLPPAILRALDAAKGDRTSGALLLRADGSNLDRRTADRWIKSLSKKAGIDKPISPHSLRHAFVTNALDAGVSLRDVQTAARHSDPRTTARYDRNRHSMDRHAVHTLTAYLSGGI